MDSSGSGHVQMTGFCEIDSKPLSSTKCGQLVASQEELRTKGLIRWNSPFSTGDCEGTTVPVSYSRWGWSNDKTVTCGRGKSKFLDKNMPQCNFSPDKSLINYPGNKPGSPLREAVD
jgi:hypothetical protein